MDSSGQHISSVLLDSPVQTPINEDKGHGELSSHPANAEFQMSRLKVLKNLAVVSFAFMFLFTAFMSMTNLQSSLNKEDNIGTGGLSIIYGALIISCMFLPTWLIQTLGCKWTIAVSMVCYIPYMAAQFYPTWGLIGPTSAILGVGAAPLWASKCTYLSHIGQWYSRITEAHNVDTISRFFGIFFMVFQTSQVWGNLISSETLATKPDANVTVDFEICGANWCPWYENKTTAQPIPNFDQIYLMFAIYLASACVSILIVVIFLDDIKLKKHGNKQGKMSPKLLIETLRHIWHSSSQKLLVPLTIYSGIEQAFLWADYTKSFITCPIGVWNVGYVMVCFGVTNALCSFAFGRLVQFVGLFSLFIFAALLHLGLQITLLLWVPRPDTVVVLYALAALWGMGDAVWQAQINALYGYIFSTNSEAGFANYRLWESVGFIIAFAYAGSLCTFVKIYVCIGVLAVGMLGYVAVEIKERRRGGTHD